MTMEIKKITIKNKKMKTKMKNKIKIMIRAKMKVMFKIWMKRKGNQIMLWKRKNQKRVD